MQVINELKAFKASDIETNPYVSDLPDNYNKVYQFPLPNYTVEIGETYDETLEPWEIGGQYGGVERVGYDKKHSNIKYHFYSLTDDNDDPINITIEQRDEIVNQCIKLINA